LLRWDVQSATAYAIVIAIFAATIAASGASAKTSWSCFQQKASERRFVKKMNYARSQRDLGRLSFDKQLSHVARLHTKQMAAEHRLYHSNPKRLIERVTHEKLLSENVGRGGAVASIHKAFMDSDAHKANILRSNWRHVGVGTATRDGVVYVTVVFESRRDPGTTVKPPSC
jgi:uncharacterized protein YkwD